MSLTTWHELARFHKCWSDLLPACCGYPSGPSAPRPGWWKPPGPEDGGPGKGLPMPAMGWPAMGGPAIGGLAMGGPAIGGPAIGGPAMGGPAIGVPTTGGDCGPGDICCWDITAGRGVWKGCWATELAWGGGGPRSGAWPGRKQSQMRIEQYKSWIRLIV